MILISNLWVTLYPQVILHYIKIITKIDFRKQIWLPILFNIYGLGKVFHSNEVILMPDTLGLNLKKLRKKRTMTLKALAIKTGFSISFLSQLERGKSSATLESLKKISLALDVTPGYFFDDILDNKQFIQRNGMETKQMEKQNIYYRSLNSSIDQPAFIPHYVVLKPNQNKGNLFKHPGQEFLYVLEGQLTVKIDKEKYLLDPSDSIMFDSSKEHYWYNFTNMDVKFLCVSYDEK